MSCQPICQAGYLLPVHAHQGIVRTSSLARRATKLVNAQVTFGRFTNVLIARVHEKLSLVISHINHLDIVIRTTIGTRCAANARTVVDHDIACFFVAPDCSRGTANHAYWVDTVHARVGKHVLIVNFTLAIKTRIVVVC